MATWGGPKCNRFRCAGHRRYVSTEQRTTRSLLILKPTGILAIMLGSAGVFVIWALLSFSAAFGANGAMRFPFIVALAVAASTAVVGAALLAVSFVLELSSGSQVNGGRSNRA
jgi:hypothetical protein